MNDELDELNLPTDDEFRSCIKKGRSAIGWRMLGVVLRPRTTTPEDEAELNALQALANQYDELMAEKHWNHHMKKAANDENDGSEA